MNHLDEANWQREKDRHIEDNGDGSLTRTVTYRNAVLFVFPTAGRERLWLRYAPISSLCDKLDKIVRQRRKAENKEKLSRRLNEVVQALVDRSKRDHVKLDTSSVARIVELMSEEPEADLTLQLVASTRPSAAMAAAIAKAVTRMGCDRVWSHVTSALDRWGCSMDFIYLLARTLDGATDAEEPFRALAQRGVRILSVEADPWRGMPLADAGSGAALLAALTRRGAASAALELLSVMPIVADAEAEAVVALVRALSWDAAAKAVLAAMHHRSTLLPAISTLMQLLCKDAPVAVPAAAAAYGECVRRDARIRYHPPGSNPWDVVLATVEVVHAVDDKAARVIGCSFPLADPVIPSIVRFVQQRQQSAAASNCVIAVAGQPSATPSTLVQLVDRLAEAGCTEVAIACAALLPPRVTDGTMNEYLWVYALVTVARTCNAACVEALAAALAARTANNGASRFLTELSRSPGWRAHVAAHLLAAPSLRAMIERSIRAAQQDIANLGNPAAPMARARFPADPSGTVERFLRSPSQTSVRFHVGHGVAYAQRFAAQHRGVHVDLDYALTITVRAEQRR